MKEKNITHIYNFNAARFPGALAIASLALILAMAGTSCKNNEEQEPLRVAVAANVQFAFEELSRSFTEKTGIPVKNTLGSSGKLTTQIQNGAPFHIFLSANMKYPRALLASGDASGDLKVYARGGLVAWTMDDKIDINRWDEEVLSSETGKVAMANPKNAPYGVAAEICLTRKGLLDQVRPRLVMGESISQTNQFIVSGAADLGFTAKSVVLSPDLQNKGTWSEIPSDCYEPIEQGVVILNHGMNKNAESTRMFYEFLSTEQAKDIFRKYGYSTD